MCVPRPYIPIAAQADASVCGETLADQPTIDTVLTTNGTIHWELAFERLVLNNRILCDTTAHILTLPHYHLIARPLGTRLGATTPRVD